MGLRTHLRKEGKGYWDIRCTCPSSRPAGACLPAWREHQRVSPLDDAIKPSCLEPYYQGIGKIK